MSPKATWGTQAWGQARPLACSDDLCDPRRSPNLSGLHFCTCKVGKMHYTELMLTKVFVVVT